MLNSAIRFVRLALLSAMLGCTSSGLFQIDFASAQPIDIKVAAEQLNHFKISEKKRRQFGLLKFAGGLVFWSDHSSLGGISGFRMLDQGVNFLSVTDYGSWFEGGFVRDQQGRLVGIEKARIAPLKGINGKNISSKRLGDAEGLEILGDRVLVSFEQKSRINTYSFKPSLLSAQPVAFRKSINSIQLPRNKGLEAIVVLGDDIDSADRDPEIVVFSEFGQDKKGNIRAFVSDGPDWDEFSVQYKDGYQITDAVSLSQEYLLILERQYSFTTGARIRIRKLAKADIFTGALVDGETLLEFDSQYEIDNFEGISLWKRSDDQMMLTIISDNNFSVLQRNLILEFEIGSEVFN